MEERSAFLIFIWKFWTSPSYSDNTSAESDRQNIFCDGS
jgi:hypothetical protein